MKHLNLLLFLFLISSCAQNRSFIQIIKDTFGTKDLTEQQLMTINDQSYENQLFDYAKRFDKEFQHKIIKLPRFARQYLNGLVSSILLSNELLFQSRPSDIKLHIIKNSIPYVFSLPKGYIYISTGYIKELVSYEGVLYSVLTHQLIQSLRSIYEKRLLLPMITLNEKELIRRTEISLVDRVAINKWAFYSLKRTNSDAFYYLSWLQLISRRIDLFEYNNYSVDQLAIEESRLKSFIISKNYDRPNDFWERNSSSDFYRFISIMERYY